MAIKVRVMDPLPNIPCRNLGTSQKVISKYAQPLLEKFLQMKTFSMPLLAECKEPPCRDGNTFQKMIEIAWFSI